MDKLYAQGVVTAQGTSKLLPAYEMTVTVTPEALTIDGLTMDWNGVWAALDASVSLDEAREALFGRKKARRRARR